MNRSAFRAWIEAMRLRTLPVSAAGVVAAAAVARLEAHAVLWLPVAICLVFALLAQVASNFANEYYDWRAGLDAPGRVGPRRGVTEGDLTPAAMLRATYLTLALAAAAGLSLLLWAGWWLLPAGVVVCMAALAYSTGPWPLSHHGLGELTVVAFFGLVPVTLTFCISTGLPPTAMVWCTATAMGLMGANVLMVNNYRDRTADAAVGKRTLAVRMAPAATRRLYLLSGIAAQLLLLPAFLDVAGWCVLLPALGLSWHLDNSRSLARLEGAALNPLLGRTALLMFLSAIFLLIVSLI